MSKLHTSKAVRGILAASVAFAAVASQAQELIIAQMKLGVHPAVGTRYGLRIVDHTQPAPFVLYRTPAGSDLHAIQAQMRLDGNYVFAEDDDTLTYPEGHSGGKGGTVAAIMTRESVYQQNSAMLTQINFNPATTQGPGRVLRVAILDTGLSAQQPELWGRVYRSFNAVEPDKPAYDRAWNKDTNANGAPDEALGHGTMVAGLVYQMSPKSQLVIARVADSDGVSSAWNLTKGLAFAAVQGAELVNISLGSLERIPAISDVLDWTETQGMQIVAPIGNNNQRTALSPAEISKVICVAGVTSTDTKAAFSNWAGTTDLAAPATGIKSYWWNGQMGIWSGTSFAAPLVTGSLAEALRKRSKLTPAKIRDAVEDSGDNINPKNPSFKDELGTRLNFGKLIQRIYAWQ